MPCRHALVDDDVEREIRGDEPLTGYAFLLRGHVEEPYLSQDVEISVVPSRARGLLRPVPRVPATGVRTSSQV